VSNAKSRTRKPSDAELTLYRVEVVRQPDFELENLFEQLVYRNTHAHLDLPSASMSLRTFRLSFLNHSQNGTLCANLALRSISLRLLTEILGRKMIGPNSSAKSQGMKKESNVWGICPDITIFIKGRRASSISVASNH
jgi:hypothetical protein